MWVPPCRPSPHAMPPAWPARRRNVAVLLGSALAIAGAATAMFLLWPSGDPAPPPTLPPHSTESDLRNDPAAEVAERWLTASRTVSHNDPSPTTWIERALPLTTGPLDRELRRARDGSPGADWSTFVARRCRTSVEQLHVTIPAEAPRTDDSVYVQLSAVVVTHCAKGQDKPTSEPVAATVGVLRGPDGTWRVNRRLF